MFCFDDFFYNNATPDNQGFNELASHNSLWLDNRFGDEIGWSQP